jgi:hypothetical protein
VTALPLRIHSGREGRDRVAARFQTYPDAERLEPGLCRGELRLAAEAMIARDQGVIVPPFVYDRVRVLLTQLAR